MYNLMQVLGILFKEVSVSQIIDKEISYNAFDMDSFIRLGKAHMKHCSNTELENLYRYLQSEINTFRKHIYDLDLREQEDRFNVFDALFVFAEKVLRTEGPELLCRYKYLAEWRQMSLALGEDIFISAYFAARDAYHSDRRNWFFWKSAISTDNIYLRRILDRGMAENHFHLKGSVPSADISWIILMNHILDYSFKGKLDRMDERRLHYTVAYDFRCSEESLWILALQAALIRAYLFCMLEGRTFLFTRQIIDIRKIETHILYGNISHKPWISKDEILKVFNGKSAERMTLEEILNALKTDGYNPPGEENANNENMRICQKILRIQQYTRDFFESWRGEFIDMRTLLIKSLPFLECINLKDAKMLMSSEEYDRLCESETTEYIHELLLNSEKLTVEAEEIQSMIHQIGDEMCWGFSGTKSHEYPRLDYFLLPIMAHIQSAPGYKVLLAGERYFLYRYLRYAYTRTENKDRLLNLFYRYVAIKNRMWNELTQTNDNVGFNNFQQYQDRKEEFIEGTIYEKYYLQIAVAGTLTSQNIQKLEARIVPKDTAEKNHDVILRHNQNIREAFEEEFGGNSSEVDKYMNSLFYVYHFIKEKGDCLEQSIQDNLLRYRHYEKRRRVYRQCMAIVNLRERYYESAKYVYGIDAAADEIVCRPEVFAQAFRYLKNHMAYKKSLSKKSYQYLPNLRVTYHVGEDFLDVLDGLRAIDEAIYFLDMQCGDRLGHALALGIDVGEWYESKKYKILIGQQDYLDNLTWLYGKIRKFQLTEFDDVKMYIEKEFDEYMRIIYLNNINEGYLKAVISKAKDVLQNRKEYSFFESTGFQFDINSYYDAWKLRCDNPECYFDGFFKNSETDSGWGEYATNKKYPENYKIRNNPAAAFIYHCYHYIPKIKKCGTERIEKEIPRNMIRCVAAVQRAMQDLVAAKGICIECNPSSNYKIGTFKEYGKHPISRFYNKELTDNPEELHNCPQLSVSINTDDQGVFYTSLENEYALMALALEKAKDENGKPRYNRMKIYDWMDAVRQMGLLQSFK